MESTTMREKSGPLAGLRVVEIASVAPAPFGCMILADLGAEVITVERASSGGFAMLAPPGVLNRGRRSIAVNLKSDEGREVVMRLVDSADVFVEGFRPGVAERMGIGPDELLARNPRLIYGRMTGWGQNGPLAPYAGHDINYIAISGALEPIGRAGERPVPPLNLLGDFGGGGMLLALGILAALQERTNSGRGQVVDAAMVDGSNLLMSFIHAMNAAGLWDHDRGSNMLDGAGAFYDTYECSDGKYVAVGCVEPQFYAEFLRILELDGEDLPMQYDLESADVLKERIGAVFSTRARDEWAKLFENSDACVSPVLSPFEAHEHPHNADRRAFVEVGGIRQPAPAPRFSRTPAEVPSAAPTAGVDTLTILRELGYSQDEVAGMQAAGSVE